MYALGGVLTVTTGGRKRRYRVNGTGGGCFSTVFYQKERVFIRVNAGDQSKDIVARLPRMPHLPDLKLLESDEDGKRLFVSPRYWWFGDYALGNTDTSAALRQYRTLEYLARKATRGDTKKSVKKFNILVQKEPALSAPLKRAIRSICEAAMDAGG